MNIHEAKKILLAYRPGTADATDTEVSAALELARQDADLGRWLEAQSARQDAVRDKFRQIAPPAGLKEQILSEHGAGRRRPVRPTSGLLVGAVGVLAVLVAVLFVTRLPSDKELTIYRNRMVSEAMRGYSMDLVSADIPKINGYLKQKGAPVDYTLPPPLAKAPLVGCATQIWQGAKVSMLCFRTGKPLASGAQSDLWLFVIDRGSLRDAPKAGAPVFTRVNKVMTVMWTSEDKTYLLGAEGDEAYLKTLL